MRSALLCRGPQPPGPRAGRVHACTGSLSCTQQLLSPLNASEPTLCAVQLFSLQDQVQHHLSYIRDYVLPRRVPAIVLGHSIGAFIAVEACHRLSQATGRPASDLGVRQVSRRGRHCCLEPMNSSAACVQVWAVFPFLSVNKDCRRQTAIRRLTQLPLLLAAGAALLALLPSAVKHFIAARYTGASLFGPVCAALCAGYWPLTAQLAGKLFTANAQAACVRLVGFTTAHNALYMGKREFRELTLGVAWAPLQALGEQRLTA